MKVLAAVVSAQVRLAADPSPSSQLASLTSYHIDEVCLERMELVPATHPVARILYQRRNEGSLPRARTDGYRVGLAIEGGGMRGIVSAAMMTALVDRQLIPSFDAFYGFSAGGLNSAYFLSGVGWYALSVYYDPGVSRAFLDARRMLRRQPAMSLNYIVDVAMESIRPLDYASVLASPIEFHVVASSIRDLAPKAFTHFESKEDLKVVLKASAWMPIAAGPPIAHEGDLFLDGGVLLAHPVLTALEDGCTHVLVLRTRMNNSSRPALWAGQHVVAAYLQQMHPGLGAAYLRTTERYKLLRHDIQEASWRQEGPPFMLDVSTPTGAHRVTTFSQDQGVLFQGARAGYSAMMQAIEARSDEVYLRPTLLECS